jgi:GTP-binding protein
MLLDSRVKPQESDMKFMEMLGLGEVPFARIFTKADKIKSREVNKTIKEHNELMLESWEELPQWFVSSSVKKTGREELLNFIQQTINNWKKGK